MSITENNKRRISKEVGMFTRMYSVEELGTSK